MHKGNGKIKHAAIFALVLALLFNSIGSLFAAGSVINQAQSFANQDATLICTGKTFKWISLRAFEESGIVEYIDPPEGAPDSSQHLKCAYVYLAESGSDDEIVGFDSPKIGQDYSQFLPQYSEFLALGHKYQFASTRAPPQIS